MGLTRRSAFFGAVAAAGCAHQTASATEGRVAVIGGSVVWRRFGDGPRTPLLVVHGGPGAPSDYLEPLGALGDERAVYVWDQLGCGRSDRPSDASLWTIERFVDEMARVRTALGLRRVHVLGQSWGTMLTVDYLLRRGEAGVKSVVLAGPIMSARRYIEDTRRMLGELSAEQQAAVAEAERTGDFASPAYKAATEAFYALHIARAPTAVTGPLLERAFGGLGEESYVAMNGPSEFSILGSLKTYEREAELGRIRTPLLYLSGEFDTCTPDAARQYAAQTPGARVEVVAGAAHLTTIDAPDATNAIVRAFLREHDG
ncbi:MAG: proline iminopeptidase-family hydrolase [Hyphomonadaceae bacterium]|nr:proline iminopeptidase-family hydrolase [Hyphomonadaceae bacterium]